MGEWFPKVYDTFMKPFEQNKFKNIRKLLANQAVGRVLEIGSGTGINFPYYKRASHVDAIEPDPLMKERSLENLRNAHVPITLYSAEAERLPFADNTFDSVMATLVFCTIPDPLQALKEIERVSQSGSDIMLFEHVRLNQMVLGKTQDVLTPLWKKVCGGCHLNRDILGLLSQSNLSVVTIDPYYKGVFLSIKCINDK